MVHIDQLVRRSAALATVPVLGAAFVATPALAGPASTSSRGDDRSRPASVGGPAAGSGARVAASDAAADLCARVASNAGFTGDGLVMSVAIALAESACNPSARGVNTDGTVDRGLWQINNYWHPDVSDQCAYDPQCNANAAFRISSGGTNWKPWSTYGNGAYRGHLAEAQAAVDRLHPEIPDVQEIAFQANIQHLYTARSTGERVDTGLGMMPGTSPSTAVLTNGQTLTAFQANNGELWVVGPNSPGDTHLGMAPGTSPSIAALSDGGWEVAFEANTGELWKTGTAGSGGTGQGMMPGTSPAITGMKGGSFEIAFQANTGSLFTYGGAGGGDTQLGMAAGTSPAITALVGGGYEVAFQANTGHLWTAGAPGTGDTGLGMAAGTSPAITTMKGGGVEMAFQANTGHMWTAGDAGGGDSALGMAPGTSPAITAPRTGGYKVAFQANTGSLWTSTPSGSGSWDLGLAAGTSPSIASSR